MHLLLIKHAIHLIAVYETPICGALAILKGGKPERIGTVVFIAAILLTDLFFAVGAHPWRVGTAVTATFKSGSALPAAPTNVRLGSAPLLSCFFLYLAIRYGSLWLAAAMIIEASELYFARLYIDGFSSFPLYAIELNAICVLVLFTLAGAAMSSWRMRVVKRRQEATRA